MANKKTVPAIVLGADPEFVFEKAGTVVKACDIVKDVYCGFGADGQATIAELRPGFSASVTELVAKLEKTMVMGNSRLGLDKKTDRWLAGHYKHNKSIGGHIHIRCEKTINTGSRNNFSNLGKLLDYYIEDCLEDLIAPPGERIARQATGQYGKKYDEYRDAIRVQDDHRIEYRPPGSWLLTPKIAFTYLYVAKAAATLNALRIKEEDVAITLNDADDKVEALEEMAKIIGKRADLGRDMLLGRDIMEEVIREIPDWDQDFRGNWLCKRILLLSQEISYFVCAKIVRQITVGVLVRL